jgi:hypothetical protein
MRFAFLHARDGFIRDKAQELGPETCRSDAGCHGRSGYVSCAIGVTGAITQIVEWNIIQGLFRPSRVPLSIPDVLTGDVHDPAATREAVLAAPGPFRASLPGPAGPGGGASWSGLSHDP